MNTKTTNGRNINNLIDTQKEVVSRYVVDYLGEFGDTIPTPKALVTLCKKANAEICFFGDETMGIEVNGKLWAVEQPHEMRGCLKGLPHEVWQWLYAASGYQAWDGSLCRWITRGGAVVEDSQKPR